jgi:hypothetical protein
MRRPIVIAALVVAWPAAAADPLPEPPDPEFLVFLGETMGVDDEFIEFMETRAAQQALKNAGKKVPKEDDDD